MSATREELRHYFQYIEELIQEKFYFSAEGRGILADLLKNKPLSAGMSPAFNLPAKYLQNILQQPKNPTCRLTRIAMNLALLQFGNRPGKSIFQEIRLWVFKDDIELAFERFEFRMLTPIQVDGFCGALHSMPIKELSIRIAWFSHADQPSYENFFDLIIKHPTLTTFVFDNAAMESFSAEKKSIFFEMIKFSKLTTLNLRDNRIGEFALDDFKEFCKALQASKLVNLHMKYTKLSSLESQKRHMLLEALLSNFYLQQVKPMPPCFSKNEKKEIRLALKRNMFIHEMRLNYKAIMADLTNRQLQQQNLNDITNMEVRIKTFRRQLKQTRKLVAPYASEAYLNELIKMSDEVFKMAAYWFAKHRALDKALPCLLHVSFHNPNYHDVHSRAFELAYAGHYDKTNKDPAFTAFMAAIGCCLDHRRHFMFNGFLLNASGKIFDKRKVFSGYLCSAAGITLRVNEVAKIGEKERKILLKLVLVRSLCESISNGLPGQTVTLFQSREERLLYKFLALPRLIQIQDISKLGRALDHHVWESALAIASASSDNMQKILFKAADLLPEVRSEKLDKAPRSSNKMKF